MDAAVEAESKPKEEPKLTLHETVAQARARLKHNPKDQDAARVLCGALIKGRRHRNVAHVATPFVNRENCNPQLLFHFAVTADACNDKGAAVIAYRRCVKARPDWAEAWLNLSAVAKGQNLLEEAIRAAEKGIELKPDVPEGHNNLGQALSQKNRHEEALAAYDKAIELRLDYARAHANRAQALLKLERPDEAEQACRDAIKANSTGKEGYTNLAVVLLARGRVRDAMNCTELAKLYPNDPEVLSNWGVTLKESGFVEDALNRQAQAQAVAPANPTPKWNEAHVRLLIGDYSVGLERYESCWGTPEFKASLCPFDVSYWKWREAGQPHPAHSPRAGRRRHGSILPLCPHGGRTSPQRRDRDRERRDRDRDPALVEGFPEAFLPALAAHSGAPACPPASPASTCRLSTSMYRWVICCDCSTPGWIRSRPARPIWKPRHRAPTSGRKTTS